MQEAWRWFGANDPVPLNHVRQSGAHNIVSALHNIPIGEAWTVDAVTAHQLLINAGNHAGKTLQWRVVESIPVHDAIKRADKSAAKYISAYNESLRALGAVGITTVCYNFMPLLDWTRTDLEWQLDSGGRTLRFDAKAFAAFDLFILKRPGAEADYSEQQISEAEILFNQLNLSDIGKLTNNILAGLPGSTTESHRLITFQRDIECYNEIGSPDLRANLLAFLQQILPTAEEFGIRLAIHPDDPPRSLLGLPRVVSTRDDLANLFLQAPSSSNGLTFCTGSLGVRADNNLPAIAREFGERIYFAHLRGTRREADGESFHEAEHLDSDVDMLAIIGVLLAEERRRKADHVVPSEIPFRPDHGYQIFDDLDKPTTNPGYTGIGRLKGLAELRGAIAATEYLV